MPKYLILFFLSIQLVYGQDVIYESSSENYKYLNFHDDWGKKNYLKLVKEFKLSPLNKGEIIFLGNSITAEGKDWNIRLNNSYIRNRGIGGDTTDGIIARTDEIIFSNPKAVFLLIGINDLYNNTIEIPSSSYIANNIIKIAKKIKAGSSDTKIFIQTLLPISKKKSRRNYKLYNANIKDINRVIIENKNQNLYSVIDLFSLFVNDKGQLKKDLTYDGLHLNNKGYIVWSNYIKPIIDSL